MHGWSRHVRILAVLAATALGLGPGGYPAAAQTPPAEQTVTVPGSLTMPPGGVVTFQPVPPPPTGGGLRVQNSSNYAATVAYDGQALTITLPAGFAARIESFAELLGRVACSWVDRQPSVLRCSVPGPPFPPDTVLDFTAGPFATRDRPLPGPIACPGTVSSRSMRSIRPPRSSSRAVA